MTGEQWLTLAPALCGWPSAVVIDHLGLPGRSAEADRCMLDLAARDQVWVKVSGTYRSAPGAAAGMLRRILDEVGPDRPLWGSDWPWTQHEPGRRLFRLAGRSCRCADPAGHDSDESGAAAELDAPAGWRRGRALCVSATPRGVVERFVVELAGLCAEHERLPTLGSPA